jgi:hypothetical protein
MDTIANGKVAVVTLTAKEKMPLQFSGAFF